MADSPDNLVVAIDGTAASGKSSAAREVAGLLGMVYVNSGAMYRALAWLACQRQVDVDDETALVDLLHASRFDSGISGGRAWISIGGEDPTPYLNEDRVNRAVSAVARHAEVRAILVDWQRSFHREADLVMEGRDIGTVVFPDTPYKFFVDASPDVRAQRRSAQGFQDVVVERDRVDSSRKASPLKQAPEACVIDSSHLSLQEVVEKILQELRRRGFPADRMPGYSVSPA